MLKIFLFYSLFFFCNTSLFAEEFGENNTTDLLIKRDIPVINNTVTDEFLYEKAASSRFVAKAGFFTLLGGIGLEVTAIGITSPELYLAGFVIENMGAIASSGSASGLNGTINSSGIIDSYSAWHNYKVSWLWTGLGVGCIFVGATMNSYETGGMWILGGLVSGFVGSIYRIGATVGPWRYSAQQMGKYQEKSSLSFDVKPLINFETKNMGGILSLAYTF